MRRGASVGIQSGRVHHSESCQLFISTCECFNELDIIPVSAKHHVSTSFNVLMTLRRRDCHHREVTQDAPVVGDNIKFTL